MNPAAAKEKRGSSGRSRTYLKTRVRGQRLQNAALILAFIELTQRLHQAYRQAYDKQTAEWLLPQNTKQQMSPDEISGLRKQLEAFLTGKCKDLVEATMKNIKGGVYSNDLVKLFNTLADSGKLFSDPQLQGAGGYGGGNVADKTASLTIRLDYRWSSPVWTAIEELTHANGSAGSKYISHDAMAQAAIDGARSIGVSLDKVKNTNTPVAEVQDPSTLKGDLYNSVLFRNVLAQACH